MWKLDSRIEELGHPGQLLDDPGTHVEGLVDQGLNEGRRISGGEGDIGLGGGEVG